jgi:ppGpp synthetase/RelA/SpoT-type nucleotidyltranferase
VADPPSYSKREVSRAGQHLANRLRALRRGDRQRLVDPEDSTDVHARAVVEWWRAAHVASMLHVADVVEAVAPELEIGDDELVTAVSSRAKRLDAMVDKLLREPGKLADMADIGGVRAVLNSQDECDSVAEELAEMLDVRRVRDWTRSPRPTGYRAIHLHAREAGRLIEIQLRTFGQDAWANVVEEESRLTGLNYKAGHGDEDVLRLFSHIADLFAVIELSESHPDLATELHDAFVAARSKLQTPMLRDLLL